MKKHYSHIIIQTAGLMVIWLLLMIPCIYNAFPLVTSDSGTYIGSGLKGWVPIDRPLFYGLFVGFLSFKQSLWYPIIAQNLILAYLLVQVYRYFLKTVKNGMVYFFVTLFICSLTGIAWYSAQLMPDIFVGIGFFCMVLLLVKPIKKTELIILTIIYIISLITHNSHMLIFCMLTLVILVVVMMNIFSIRNVIPIKNVYYILIISIGSWIINPTINFIYEGKFKHSGSPYAFLVAKYAENGILTAYLKEKCVPKINTTHQIENGTYFLKNLQSNLFLDVEGYSMEAGAKVHQWEYTGADNQQFRLEKISPQVVKIASVKSGKYVTSYQNNEGKFALKQDHPANNYSQLFEINYDAGTQSVSLKLNKGDVYIGSDTVSRNLGIQFIEGNRSEAAYCRYQLISAANCFCYFKDSIPANAMAFLWDGKSILSRTGNWANHEKEYKLVMHDILFSPDYFWRNVKAAWHATTIQLTRNNIGDGIAKYDTTSSPYYAIKTNLPELKTKFLQSRENRGELEFVLLNYLNEYLMKISLSVVVLMLLVSYFRKKITVKLVVFACLTLMMLFINAFVTGAMANILDRLQSRISWLLPLAALMMVYNFLEQRPKEGNEEVASEK